MNFKLHHDRTTARHALDGSQSGKTRTEGQSCLVTTRHEPFCTVLREQVSDAIDVSKGQFTRQTGRLDPSRNRVGPRHKQGLPGAPVVFMKL